MKTLADMLSEVSARVSALAGAIRAQRTRLDTSLAAGAEARQQLETLKLLCLTEVDAHPDLDLEHRYWLQRLGKVAWT